MRLDVRSVPEFDLQYDELMESAQNNCSSRILFKKLLKAIEKLKYDFKAGEHISKEKIPVYYKQKYGVENLWKLNLDQDYGLVYAIRGTENEVTSVLLEFFDHKEYERRFGYK
ncbi:hypothetical protein HZC09_02435 [Candidatus Micrarchaeota archaeon]|nr:hypothetical protein [Candidatus Micrarchaeota archaeon]